MTFRTTTRHNHLAWRSVVASWLLVAAVAADAVSAAPTSSVRTPIQRLEPAAAPAPVTKRSPSGGTTLVLLGLLLGGAILSRRVFQQRRTRSGGSDVLPITLLDRRRIDHELTIRVLQVGSRVIVVGASPQGLATLAEVADPTELSTSASSSDGETLPFTERSAIERVESSASAVMAGRPLNHQTGGSP